MFLHKPLGLEPYVKTYLVLPLPDGSVCRKREKHRGCHVQVPPSATLESGETPEGGRFWWIFCEQPRGRETGDGRDASNSSPPHTHTPRLLPGRQADWVGRLPRGVKTLPCFLSLLIECRGEGVLCRQLEGTPLMGFWTWPRLKRPEPQLS